MSQSQGRARLVAREEASLLGGEATSRLAPRAMPRSCTVVLPTCSVSISLNLKTWISAKRFCTHGTRLMRYPRI